jgi:hypothetical protein
VSAFQERLWQELVRDHATALAAPIGWRDELPLLPVVERRRAPLRLRRALRADRLLPAPGRLAGTLAAVAVAIALSVIFTTTGTAPSAAYAVTQNGDGTITVSIEELTGIAGANAQLSRLGVRVRVAPVQAGCASTAQPIPPPGALAARIAHVPSHGEGLVVAPDLTPAGDTLVLTARRSGSIVTLGYALYRGAAPPCVSLGEDRAG